MHNDKVNALQDKLRQVGILGEFADVLVDHIGIDGDGFALAVGGGVADVFQQAFHNRLQAAGTNILDR